MTNSLAPRKTLITQAIIFDMDGTIVDNMQYHIKSWIKFFQLYGVNMTLENFHQEFAGSAATFIERKLNQSFTANEIHTLHEKKEEIYRHIYKDHIKELEGLTTLLRNVKKQGIKIGIATLGNKKNVDFSIAALEIDTFLDSIKKSEDITQGKPHPEIYLKSLDALNVSPDNAIAFEDSRVGITAAIAANINVIGVQTSHSKEELMGWGATDTIKNYVEFSKRYKLKTNRSDTK